jgi:hypothetical protein
MSINIKMAERKKVFMETLVSIGLIADTGETFYAELNDYDVMQVDEWLKEHIIKNLLYAPPLKGEEEYWIWDKNLNVRMRGNKQEVSRYLADWFQAILGGPVSFMYYSGVREPFLIENHCIEIWSDCLSYDWILFNDLWGSAFNTPKCVYYIPFDICTYFKLKGVDPDISREEYASLSSSSNKHNALWDAKVIKKCFEKLSAEVYNGNLYLSIL